MIHRQTQTAAFWKTYQVQTEDAEFIFSQLLEEGKPRRTIDLAQSLLQHKVEHENAALRAQLNSKGAVYLPRNRYAPGDQLNFPLLGFLGGVVTATRPGNNPEVGEPGAFEVISVDLNDGTKREFAGGYPLPHKLNDLDVSTLVNAEDLQTPEQLFELHGDAVCAAVESALEKNGEVLRIGQEWYLRAMMAEVNVGHLNLAEAVLDIAAGKPLTAAVILHDLGLPEDVTATVQEASLNSALACVR